MHKILEYIEHIVDKSIPYLVILLLFVIIGDVFYHEYMEHYHLYVLIFDYFILVVFMADLIFKWFRIRHFTTFLKKCWIDIIAVFPFFIFFRLIEEVVAIFAIGETIKEAQHILHTGVELEKEASHIIQSVEKAGKVSRVRMAARLIRPLQRLPRLLKAFSFYEKPFNHMHLKNIGAKKAKDKSIKNKLKKTKKSKLKK